MTKTQRICIVGGGFGGLYTALRLHELPWETEATSDNADTLLFRHFTNRVQEISLVTVPLIMIMKMRQDL